MIVVVEVLVVEVVVAAAVVLVSAVVTISTPPTPLVLQATQWSASTSFLRAWQRFPPSWRN